jgi:putative nucleotidyltransferase with HDIG domain
VRQFWHALTAKPSPVEIKEVGQLLPSELMALFMEMKENDQAHSLWVYHQIQQQEIENPDLFVASLLHDIGKSRYPLSLWDRLVIVLGSALFPAQVKNWGKGGAKGWKRAFAISEQHASWGAEMAYQAGASAMVVSLIRRHQDKVDDRNGDKLIYIIPTDNISYGGNSRDLIHLEDQLLRILQKIDEQN